MPARFKDIEVIKEDGKLESFSLDKLNHSLERAHVAPQLCQAVGDHLSEQLHHTCTTHDIRSAVKRYLKKNNKYAAARYDLRRALMDLGPSGFPFERYIGFLFEELGYHVQIGQTVAGRCVTHEVDVIASKDDQIDMIECKYHNSFGVRSDVKVAMYVSARFEDVREAYEAKVDQSRQFNHGWLVTNTKLTADARKFATCRGLRIMSWDEPIGHNLQDVISQTCLYPITSLSSLKTKTKQLLIEHDIVACKQLRDVDTKRLTHLPQGELHAGQHEAHLVCELPS